MKEITNIELIERYVSGELNSSDTAAFEKQIDADPKLKSEVEFQKDMISALQNARQSELKMRLAAINVSAGLSNIQRFSIAASTLIVGSMIYFGISEVGIQTKVIAESPEKIESTSLIAVENNEAEVVSEEIVDPISVVDLSESDVITDKTAKATVIDQNNDSPQAVSGNNNLTPMVPNIPVDSEDGLEIDNINDEPKGAGYLSTKDVIAGSGVPIPKIHAAKKNGQLAYEYDKENLDLYGDFSKEYYLYELTGTGNIYLLFDEKYYEITETKSKTPLTEVQDLSIIESLNSQR